MKRFAGCSTRFSRRLFDARSSTARLVERVLTLSMAINEPEAIGVARDAYAAANAWLRDQLSTHSSMAGAAMINISTVLFLCGEVTEALGVLAALQRRFGVDDSNDGRYLAAASVLNTAILLRAVAAAIRQHAVSVLPNLTPGVERGFMPILGWALTVKALTLRALSEMTSAWLP